MSRFRESNVALSVNHCVDVSAIADANNYWPTQKMNAPAIRHSLDTLAVTMCDLNVNKSESLRCSFDDDKDSRQTMDQIRCLRVHLV